MLPQLQIVETTLKTTEIYSCSTSTRIRRTCCGAEADPYGLTGVMRRFYGDGMAVGLFCFF